MSIRSRVENTVEPLRTASVSQAEVICEQVSRIVTQVSSGLQGIILTGSVARGEGTFLRQGEGWHLMGDAEFLLVHRSGTRLLSDDIVQDLRKEIELNLARLGLHATVSFASVHPRYLTKLEPHIFAYELRTCGRVIWGDTHLLDLIPAFAESDLILEDAWRLLCNRMIELMASSANSSAKAASYSATKLYMDMATSLLIFLGSYKPTYRGRLDALRDLAEGAAVSNLPFDLRMFYERVALCTEWKLHSAEGAGSLESMPQHSFIPWRELVEDVRALWRWELCCLLGAPPTLSDRKLIRRWMRKQRFTTRLRGWLYASRRLGWQRSWRKWPAWAVRAWKASPRYWIYAAASESFFHMPDPFNAEAFAAGETKGQDWLPCAPTTSKEARKTWAQRVIAVAWNYRKFLEGTRS